MVFIYRRITITMATNPLNIPSILYILSFSHYSIQGKSGSPGGLHSPRGARVTQRRRCCRHLSRPDILCNPRCPATTTAQATSIDSAIRATSHQPNPITREPPAAPAAAESTTPWPSTAQSHYPAPSGTRRSRIDHPLAEHSPIPSPPGAPAPPPSVLSPTLKNR
jgi:hypothetical protein